jgi:vancomycin resistance protein YoaR
MKRDSLEPSELKEQSKAAGSSAPGQPAVRTTPKADQSEVAGERDTQPKARKVSKTAKVSSAQPQPPRFAALAGIDLRLVGFGVAFVGGAVATLALLSAVAFSFAGSYDNRVVPGVRVGSVDLSGATRDEVIAKLKSGYSYLGEGEVTVTTPVGATTITYQQVQRGPDVEVMADAAMAMGHTGNPMADAANVIHSALFGQDLPVVITIDPTVLAQRVHDVVGSSSIPAQDAQATNKGGAFSITPSAPGSGIDEGSIGETILDQLGQTSAPADLQAGGSFVTLRPQVGDADAQRAIALATKIAVNLKLTWNTPPTPLPAKWAPRNWTITADQVRTWIVFGVGQGGSYAPAVDPAQVQAYLTGISAKANIPATAPFAQFNASGKPKALNVGNNGVGIDLNATTTAISSYLDGLATGGSSQDSIEVTTASINPEIKGSTDVSKFVLIGSQSINFFSGPANGNGANIRVPADHLNGQVVGPGDQFSFLAAVGPIDAAHGFAMGGVIVGGHSDHTGAMGGGICSASTTMFNAAASAGLQIDERHAHYYFINRYPIGRDATVYSNGTNVWDLKWTNDTPNPILIRAWSTFSKTHVTMQLWSLPTHRTVGWTGDNKQSETKPVKASTKSPQYVSTLKPGQTYAAEVTTDGFSTSVTRIVKDASGAVIHHDHWVSLYSPVDGQLQIGGTPPPLATPTPKPIPSPTAVVIAIPAMLLRRRRVTK